MSQSIKQQIGNVALLVENYDDAIEFYTRNLRKNPDLKNMGQSWYSGTCITISGIYWN